MQVAAGEPLAPRTTLGVGGRARHFAVVKHAAGVAEAAAYANARRLPLHVLGGGSNVVVADRGVDGLVMHLDSRGREFQLTGDRVRIDVSAGEPWDEFVGWTVAQGWAGLECLSGIPGRVGATPIQNVGAYGQEVSEVIESVECYDLSAGRRCEIPAAQCQFGYRDSRFKGAWRGQYVVLSVRFQLVAGGAPALRYQALQDALGDIDRPSLAQAREVVMEQRRAKGMVYARDDANSHGCGSFFVNPVMNPQRVDELGRALGVAPPHWAQPDGSVKLPAAWLIEKAGFHRGRRSGPVGLSAHHALAIVAAPGARSAEVVAWARLIRDTVDERFGVRLLPEPSFWGFAPTDDGLPAAR